MLNDKYEEYFNPIYPLFYKNKYYKMSSKEEFYRNAIDNALKFN